MLNETLRQTRKVTEKNWDLLGKRVNETWCEQRPTDEAIFGERLRIHYTHADDRPNWRWCSTHMAWRMIPKYVWLIFCKFRWIGIAVVVLTTFDRGRHSPKCNECQLKESKNPNRNISSIQMPFCRLICLKTLMYVTNTLNTSLWSIDNCVHGYMRISIDSMIVFHLFSAFQLPYFVCKSIDFLCSCPQKAFL